MWARGRFGHNWFHPTDIGVRAHTHICTYAAASALWLPTKAQIWLRFAMCLSAPLKFVGTFHTTGVTHQQCLKPYYISLHWWIHYLSPHSHQPDLWADNLKANSLKPKCLHVWIEKDSQKSVLLMQCHWRLFGALNALPMQFSLHMKQTLKQMCCSFNQSLESHRLHLTTQQIPVKKQCRYSCKTHYTASEDRDAMATGGRKLYHLPLSVPAASIEVFWYNYRL